MSAAFDSPSFDLPSFELHSLKINGLNISYGYRSGHGQPLVFLHATGFNKAVWYQVVKNIEQPVYLFDVPGHGKSDHPEGEFHWDQTANWLAQAIEAFNLQHALGIGHSMGGQVVLSIAHQLPAVFDQLLLLDPVVLREADIQFLQNFKSNPIAKRRDVWTSPEELYEVYSHKAPFNDWDKAVLKDYTEQALKRTEDDSNFRLACNPALEACIYQNLGSEHLLEKLPEIAVPVHIIRARAKRPCDHPMSFVYSPTRSDLVDLLPKASDEQLKDWSHFFPMEYPDWLREKILALVADTEPARVS